jgi:hypothetical protein
MISGLDRAKTVPNPLTASEVGSIAVLGRFRAGDAQRRLCFSAQQHGLIK